MNKEQLEKMKLGRELKKDEVISYESKHENFNTCAPKPKEAIRVMCVMCLGGGIKEVDTCTECFCPLYPYRNKKANKHTLNNKEIISKHESLVVMHKHYSFLDSYIKNVKKTKKT